jgi:hypothetical protein
MKPEMKLRMNSIYRSGTFCRLASRLLFAPFLVVVAVALPGGDTENKKDAIAESVTRLREAWRTNQVQNVVILHVPTTTHYPLALSPARLDANPAFKLVVSGPKGLKLTEDLESHLGKLVASPTKKKCDVRWGFFFLGGKDEIVFSLHLDAKGRVADLDGMLVELQDDELFKWAESALGSVLR